MFGSKKGLFITFEGPDGSGKTSVLDFLKKKVSEDYQQYLDKFLFTREPGGTPIGEKIREILLANGNEMLPITEAFLFAASRAELFHGERRKHYENGNILISDRYVESSLVYQGKARGVALDIVKKINSYATDDLEPDHIFFLMVTPEISKKRITEKRLHNADRLDKLDEGTNKKIYQAYEEIRQAYEEIIKDDKKRGIFIDASQDLEKVCQEVYEKFKEIIDKKIKSFQKQKKE